MASSVSAAARNLGMTLGVALASVLLALQMRIAGYRGPVLQAESGLLAGAIGRVLLVSGVLCAARADPGGAAAAAYQRIRFPP